ncbi:RNA polymerase sigma factor [Paracoccus benzoatiresistens]|uniref:RNA polymerase sigma factor n=1 Tax=Paracoccus benzoatiresistens TaxID=2997341 RepID=A0ABT4J1V3_9RHOB|nr:RNA polymerase sigma factor [Paracoccus sp. EF6]MCZ0961094.1 RNA polymerase sigma factor [Paracoccus sp. EF6]
MTRKPEPSWIEARLVAARPRAVAALLHWFRNLDLAEEAFQEACLRALKTWPEKGPPRDAAAWLVMVGRNAALDQLRRRGRLVSLPPGDPAFGGATEPDMAERLDASGYQDDILRLLFVCCHPDLPATQQIALALRIVSGLPVSRIAAAFLVTESAMEQRITRAKARIAKAGIPFEPPCPAERARRIELVAAMLYLVFNEGYTDAHPDSERLGLCAEAIRLVRLVLRMFPAEPEVMGLLALMLVQHSRQKARFASSGRPILLEDQDRTRWDRRMIAEAAILLGKAMRSQDPGPYQIQAAIALLHAQAVRPEDTDWARIEQLYAALEQVAPSPVVTLNRAVAVMKRHGPETALALTQPLAQPLNGYFYYHGFRGTLLRQLGRIAEAREAFGQALVLANTPAEAAHIREELEQLRER